MRLFYIFFCIFFVYSRNTNGCINEYRTLPNGTVYMSEGFGNFAPSGKFNDKNHLLRSLHEADSIYRRTKSVKDYSDYGAMLAYSGEYLEALKIFKRIESKFPNLYATASNMGTVYELLGKNDSAYYW
jgi:tetratricopeptide (TPR) repeat protein